MKSLFFKYKKLHIWLLADFIAFIFYFISRHNRAWMNALTKFTGYIKAALGQLCAKTSISVAEVLIVLLVITAIVYIVWCIVKIIKEKQKWREKAYTAILRGVCIALSLIALFCYLWGANYWADSFQDKSGLYAQPISQEDLLKVTFYFADKLSQTAEKVQRDENGIFAVPRDEILKEAPKVYDNLENIYPFLQFDDIGVKAMIFSRWMSRMDFTGFYCSGTGEANVNIDSPACLLPSTVAHEMAHQRSFASEQECNFIGILASVTSGLPDYIYSGYLMGYIYLGNALHRADPESYQAIRENLPATVKADIADNNAYWNQFKDSLTQSVTTKVYDGILKTYGDNRGIQSYGAVVDLLVAYYTQNSKDDIR